MSLIPSTKSKGWHNDSTKKKKTSSGILPYFDIKCLSKMPVILEMPDCSSETQETVHMLISFTHMV